MQTSKVTRIAMDLRKFARGRECLVRLTGCDGGGETTVLAHFRMSGLCGTGLKPSDLIGAHCCNACHAKLDGREKCGMTRAELDDAHMRAVMRTLDAVARESRNA